ncbi:MAG: hypothetical protein WDA65_06430 [Christensenellales bacterium]
MKKLLKIGFILLGVWLIAWGALPLLAISIPEIISQIVAIVAGILIIIGKV